jgi:aspartate aminotransferase-like enzyme
MGLEAWIGSHEEAAYRVREAVARMGFTLYPDPAYAAPMISAFRVREDVVCTDLIRTLLVERNILVGGGLDELQGCIFRIGHMGRARSPEVIEEVVEGIHEFLISAGLPVEVVSQ